LIAGFIARPRRSARRDHVPLSLRDVARDVGRGDGGQPPRAEDRREVFLDPPLHVAPRLLLVRREVIEDHRRAIVERQLLGVRDHRQVVRASPHALPQQS
jgi:hypothetical protein